MVAKDCRPSLRDPRGARVRWIPATMLFGQRPAFDLPDCRMLQVPISQARMAEWCCSRCGEVTSRLTWLAVDAVERPDLTARLSDLIEFECPSCGRPLQRSQPLLVLRLAQAAPLIAARATDDERDPLESLGEVGAAVQRELGDALREVPGPAAVVTFDEIEAGVREDIDTDAEGAPAGTSEVVGHESAYRRLLSKIEATQKQQRIESGLRELALVGSEEQLREMVEQWPEVTTDEAEDRVAQHVERATTEGNRRFAISMLQTVQLCRRGNLRGAWSVRESAIHRFAEERVAPRWRAFEDERLSVTRDPLRLAQAGRDLLAVLPPGTHPNRRVIAAGATSAALLEDEGAGREQSVEDSIELGHLAISILDAQPDLDDLQGRIATLMNLSVAFVNRLRGDPAWNRTKAITHLTEALEWLAQVDDRDSSAMAQTNLALLMIERGESGDYDRAREHLELALSHRSFRRNPRDWAFTQLNLDVAYARTDSGDRQSNIRRAILHSVKGRYAARSVSDVQLLAQAEHNLANEQHALSQLAGTAPADRSRLLDRAEASAIEAARLSPIAAAPLRFGRAWLLIGQIRSARANKEGAIEALKMALTALSVDMGAH